MKQNHWLILGIVGSLIIAITGYFWAIALMDSAFNYRSPLRDTPPAPGAPLGTPITHRVVIVLIDALRADTASKPDVMPFLNELRSRSAQATIHSRPPSFSEPGYTTILTGAWPDINDGPTINLDYEDIPTFTQDDIFSAAHRLGLRTAISGYYWFEKLIPQSAVDASFYTPGEDAAADQNVMTAALLMLSGDYQLVLIHIDQIDYAGHYEGGPRDPHWDAAATRSDDLLYEIAAQLDLGQDTLIVLSDHGQIDRGGHGGPEPVTLLEPFLMAGAGVQPGTYPDIQQVDVAPTVAALLGTNIPASNQGHVRTEMLILPEWKKNTIHDAIVYQQIQLEQAYITAIGLKPSKVLVQPGQDVVDVYQQAMDAARSQRLNGERIWRGILALCIAILPAVVLILRRVKKTFWLAGAALVYVLAFNFRYTVLDGRTYSLSSVDGQPWLITYTAVTASAALVVGWLVAMLLLHESRFDARKAAQTSLDFVFFTIYLLALPILVSFAVNGLLVTWTLPEFYTAYIALLSLIQWIFVAAVGLLLVGMSAGVSMLIKRRT